MTKSILVTSNHISHVQKPAQHKKIAEMHICNEPFRIFIFGNPYFKSFLLIKLFYRCDFVLTTALSFWEYDAEAEYQSPGSLGAYSCLNHLISPFCPNKTFLLLSFSFKRQKFSIYTSISCINPCPILPTPPSLYSHSVGCFSNK